MKGFNYYLLGHDQEKIFINNNSINSKKIFERIRQHSSRLPDK